MVNSNGIHFSEETIFSNKLQNGLGIPAINIFCSSLLGKNLSRYLSTNEIWAKVLKASFFNGFPDRSLVYNKISDNLKVSAEVLCATGVCFYTKWPNKAPLFNSVCVCVCVCGYQIADSFSYWVLI